MSDSVFKTEALRDKFRTYYNNVLSQFPFEQRYIHSSYGQTFMLVNGQESNPPVILLHGSCSNSAFWFPEIMALSNNYRVYAIDIIGEAGNSCEYRPELSSNDFALWLKDVLDALGLDKTAIIGNSLGGWMALKFATAYPERVSKLILIASSGIAQIQPQFFHNLDQMRQSGDAVQVNSDIMEVKSIPDEVLEFMNLIIESYKPIQELPLYTDEELLKLYMPVLFIDGENDEIIDAKSSSQRLSRLVPSSEIHLIPNTGHVITNSTEFIIPFLSKAPL